MSIHHVTAVFTQFPWLGKHFSPKKFRHAFVMRADQDHMLLKACRDTSGGDGIVSYGSIGIRYFLFDKNGELLVRTLNPFLNALFLIQEKSVMATINALGERAVEASFIVVVTTDGIVRVTKSPKNSTLATLALETQNAVIETREKEEKQALSEIEAEMTD